MKMKKTNILNDKETFLSAKSWIFTSVILTKITVGNCHIWNGQQLKGYGIFEFRFRKHKIKLRVHRLQMYIHNGCRAIDTVMKKIDTRNRRNAIRAQTRRYKFSRYIARRNKGNRTLKQNSLFNCLRVHRLQMYIHNGCRAIDTVQHVSHLCHNKLCVRIEHLSLETAQINNNRQICKNNGECTGHYPV
jgi:ribosomal protein S16